MVSLRFFAIFVIFGVISTEPVGFSSCPGGNELPCKINSVAIDPCPEASSNLPCKIKRGRPAKISFNYTADFDATAIDSRVYWATEMDLPLLDMDTVGCHFTTCPIVKGTQQLFSQDVPISRKFPIGTYNIKWRLTSEGNECCFITAIKLTR